MSALTTLLEAAEVLGKLDAAQRERLALTARRRVLKAREVLYWQGDSWRNVLLIESGTLQSVMQGPAGRTYVVSTWEAGEEFWAHPLFDSGPNPSTLEAIEESIVYEWDGDEMLAALLHAPDAMRALLGRLIQLIRKRRQKIFDLAFNPVTSRLAGVLLEQVPAEADTAPRDLTLDQIAARVATSPEVVCRILYQLQRDGVLELTRATIKVSDRAALEGLVGTE
jgi:CRP-like cAMP-binding protein